MDDHSVAAGEAVFRDFMLRYAAAWDAYDLEAILDAYHTPCAIYKDGVQIANPDEVTKRRYFGDLLDRYRGSGVVGSEMSGFSVHDLGHNSALVTVRWTSRRADRSVASDYLDSYHFGRIGEAWKILDDTVHD